MIDTKETLGQRLARIRQEKGFTQDQLAKLAGVGQSTVGGIESGSRAKVPGSLIDIAHALGVDSYYLRYGIRSIVGFEKLSRLRLTYTIAFAILNLSKRTTHQQNGRAPNRS